VLILLNFVIPRKGAKSRNNPTIETIRNLLGTGSSSTIAPYLRKWKDSLNQTQQIACKENLPEELIALLKGLWERVVAQAEERFERFKQNTPAKKTVNCSSKSNSFMLKTIQQNNNAIRQTEKNNKFLMTN